MVKLGKYDAETLEELGAGWTQELDDIFAHCECRIVDDAGGRFIKTIQVCQWCAERAQRAEGAPQ